jgi:hypothetical protein
VFQSNITLKLKIQNRTIQFKNTFARFL